MREAPQENGMEHTSQPCAICGVPINVGDDVFSVPPAATDPGDALAAYTGLPMHRSCFEQWPYRADFSRRYVDGSATAGGPPPLLPPSSMPFAQPVAGSSASGPNTDELREWLGVAPADIPCWLAIFALVGMFIINHDGIDLALAVIAVVLACVAWGIALRTKPNVSTFTNVVRHISYPANLLITLAAVAFHYWYWRG
jgi:hypothetical protein